MSVVKYARLVNLGNYENERVEFEDFVRDGETPEQAYERVRAWVHEQLQREDPLRDAEARLSALRGDVFDAEDKLRKVRQRWELAAKRHSELRELLAQHGVTIEALPPYLLPTSPQEDGEI